MEICRYQPAHLPAVLAFLRRHYPDSPAKAGPAYFQWRFGENPLGPSTRGYRVVLDEGRVVGQLATLRDRLWANGRWHECVWLIDLLLDPEYRGGLTALQLFAGVMQDVPLVLSTGAGPHTLSLYKALRFLRLPVCDTYFVPFRPGRLARMAEQSGRAARWMRNAAPVLQIADWTLPWLHRVGRGHAPGLRSRGELCVEPLAELGPELDEFLQQTLPQFDVTSYRSAAYLDWKLNARPVGRHIALAARDSASRQLRGYLVLKWMCRERTAAWAEVVDYVVDPADVPAFDALLGAAVHQALRARVDFMRFRLSRSEHCRRLCFPRWIEKTARVTDEVFAWSEDNELLSALSGSEWHLTAIVSDRADYGRDEWPSARRGAA